MYQHVLNAAQAIPGVTAVTSIENVLVSGLTSNNNVEVNGQKTSIYMNAVGPGFVETTGMRLLAGRTPGLQDVAGAPAVGALNESGARFLFGDAPAIGQRPQQFFPLAAPLSGRLRLRIRRDLGFRPENGDIVAAFEPHGPQVAAYSTFPHSL